MFVAIENQYEPIGCFTDKQEARALPILVANFRGNIDWSDLTQVVKKCATAVESKGKHDVVVMLKLSGHYVYVVTTGIFRVYMISLGYDVFAIQFYGECWSGPDAGLTYDEYGPNPDGCFNNTVGTHYTNFVYRFPGIVK